MDGECAEIQFIAFASQEELDEHRRTAHGRGMPRFDPRRARPLDVDLTFGPSTSLDAPGGPLEGGRGGRGGGNNRRGGTEGRGAGGGGARTRGRGRDRAFDPRRQEEWFGPVHVGDDGNLRIIDDTPYDLSTRNRPGHDRAGYPSFPVTPAATYPPPQGPASTGYRDRAGRAPGMLPLDAFPALGAAAAGGAAPTSARAPTASSSYAQRAAAPETPEGAPEPAPAPAPANPFHRVSGALARLVRKDRTCACGHLKQSVVIAETVDPEPLKCNAACEKEKRRKQLAEAFGVNAEDHTPWVDRLHTPAYTPRTLLLARLEAPTLEKIEKEFAAFVSDASAKRRVLPFFLTRVQRELVHGIAAQYGVVAKSSGAEPQRTMELFKGPVVRIPKPLASVAASQITQAELEAQQREKEVFHVYLIDVEPGAPIAHLMKLFQGEYVLDRVPGRNEVVLRFESKKRAQDALDVLGGGVRGNFRVDRTRGAAVQGGGAGTGVMQPGAPPPPPPPASSLTATAKGAANAVPMASSGAADSAFVTEEPRRGGGAGDEDAREGGGPTMLRVPKYLTPAQRLAVYGNPALEITQSAFAHLAGAPEEPEEGAARGPDGGRAVAATAAPVSPAPAPTLEAFQTDDWEDLEDLDGAAETEGSEETPQIAVPTALAMDDPEESPVPAPVEKSPGPGPASESESDSTLEVDHEAPPLPHDQA